MKNPFRHFRFSLSGLFAATLFVACVVATLRYATRLWSDGAFTLALVAMGVAALGAIYRAGAARAFWVGALLGGGGYLTLAYGPWIGEEVRPHLVITPLVSAAYVKMQATFNPSIAPYPPPFPSSAPMADAPYYASVSDVPQSAYADLPADEQPYAGVPLPEISDAAGGPQSEATTAIPGDSSYFVPNAVQPEAANAALVDPLLAPAASQPFAVPVYPPSTTLVSDLPEWDDLERAAHSLTALLAAYLFGVTARWFRVKAAHGDRPPC